MSELNGVALVTGAGNTIQPTPCDTLLTAKRFLGSGIGRQLSLAYARAGCQALSLADINIKGVLETIELIKSEVYNVKTLALEANTADVESVKKMVAQTVEAFGSLDYGEVDIDNNKDNRRTTRFL